MRTQALSTPLVAPVVVKAVVPGQDANASETRCHPLVGHTQVQLEDLRALVHQLAPADYTAPLPILHKASLGQHIRHILEFYITLLDAREGTVDYDARPRDKSLEGDRHAALARIDALHQALEGYTTDRPLTLFANHSLAEGLTERMETSFFRELAYGFDHGTHHMALLRIGVEQCFPHVVLNTDFGVAPSTLRARLACVR